jgi:Fe-S cluster assembly ATPase SufC
MLHFQLKYALQNTPSNLCDSMEQIQKQVKYLFKEIQSILCILHQYKLLVFVNNDALEPQDIHLVFLLQVQHIQSDF